jgi:transposase
MGRFAGSCRFVFNRALALQKEWFELSGAHASYADLCAVLVDWKQDKETDWLNEAPSQALQQSLSVKNLDAAWALRWDWLKKLKQGESNGPNWWESRCSRRRKSTPAFAIHWGPVWNKTTTHRASQTWLGAISQQPGSAGCGQEGHGEPGRWQMDGFFSDRA